MDMLPAQHCPSDMGIEIVDSFSIKPRNGGDTRTKGSTVAVLKTKEQRELVALGIEEDSVEVERRDDDLPSPRKKKVLFQVGSRKSGISRSDESETSLRDGLDDDDRSRTSRWSLSSKKPRSGGIFARNKRRQQTMETTPCAVINVDSSSTDESVTNVKAILKETEAFLKEMNESWDREDNPGATLVDETDETEATEDSPSLLGTAWKILSFQQPPEKENADSDRKEQHVGNIFRDSLRIFGMASPASESSTQESGQVNATVVIDDCVHSGEPELANAQRVADVSGQHLESPEKQNENVDTENSVGEEVYLTIAEISSVLSTQKKKKPGLLSRRGRGRKSKAEKEKDAFVSQFVPLVDDEGVQMIVVEGSTDKNIIVEEHDTNKNMSLLSRLKRKAHGRRKHRKEQKEGIAEDVSDKPKSTQKEEAFICGNSSISRDKEIIPEAEKQPKVQEEPKEEHQIDEKGIREVSAGSVSRIHDHTDCVSPIRDSRKEETFMFGIQDVLNVLTPAWPFPTPSMSIEQAEGAETHVSSSTRLSQEKRHLVKILQSDFASSSQKRKAEQRLREMYESRRSSLRSRTSRGPVQSSDDEESSTNWSWSTEVSEEDSRTEFSASTSTEFSTPPALSLEESCDASMAKAVLSSSSKQQGEDGPRYQASCAETAASNKVSTVDSLSAASLGEISQGTSTVQSTSRSRYSPRLVSTSSLDSSIHHNYSPLQHILRDTSQDAQDLTVLSAHQRYTPLQELQEDSIGDDRLQQSGSSTHNKYTPLPEILEGDIEDARELPEILAGNLEDARERREILEGNIKDARELPKIIEENFEYAREPYELMDMAECENAITPSGTFDGKSLEAKATKSATVAKVGITTECHPGEKSTENDSENGLEALRLFFLNEELLLGDVMSQSSTKEEHEESSENDPFPCESSSAHPAEESEDVAILMPNQDHQVSKTSLSSFEAVISEEEKEEDDVLLYGSDLSLQTTSSDPVHEEVIRAIKEENLREDMMEKSCAPKQCLCQPVTSLALDATDHDMPGVTDVATERVLRISRGSVGPHTSTSQAIDEGSCPGPKPRAEYASIINRGSLECHILGTRRSGEERSCSRSQACGEYVPVKQGSLESCASTTSQAMDEGSQSGGGPGSIVYQGSIESSSQRRNRTIQEKSRSRACDGQASISNRGGLTSSAPAGNEARVRVGGVTSLTQRYLARALETSAPNVKPTAFPRGGISSRKEEHERASSIIRSVARAASIDKDARNLNSNAEPSTLSFESAGVLKQIPAAEMEILKNHAKILGIEVEALIAARKR